MKLRMFGLSHQTAPVEVRELFAYSKEEMTKFFQHWVQHFNEYEIVPLSTCNRMELYIGSENGELPDQEKLFQFLCEQKSFRFNQDDLSNRLRLARRYFRSLNESESVAHLFQVVSSLDSMVVGEPQITSQVKNAYQTASEQGTTGPVTHAVFQTALRVAKRISVETEIFHHRVSIPSIAVVDFALNIFEKLSDKKTVILGAGDMARETVQYLFDQGAQSFIIVNRNEERANELAAEFNGKVCSWDNRETVLAQADIVVAATTANQFVLDKNRCRQLMRHRLGKPLFILDLCMPRNIDPACAELSDVYLYCLDDLQEACTRNRQARDQELPKALRLVQAEAEVFLHEMRHRDSGDIILQLRQTWNSVKEEELKRLFNKCVNLDEKTMGEIRYAFDRIINKLLHPPMKSLKDESKEAVPSRLIEAMKRLFRL